MPVQCTCAHCGKVFSLPPSRARQGGLYCSASCYAAAKRRPLADRFWSKVRKGDGCWEWTAARLPKGYGLIGHSPGSGEDRLAHRVSWAMHFGAIPDGLLVCHHCDNPPCVRPDHLFLGTVRDNGVDMVEKGRDRQPWAKLDACAVRAIREQFSTGSTYATLALEYGVSYATVRDAILRKTWRRVS